MTTEAKGFVVGERYLRTFISEWDSIEIYYVISRCPLTL